jgi:hypothetical protein
VDHSLVRPALADPGRRRTRRAAYPAVSVLTHRAARNDRARGLSPDASRPRVTIAHAPSSPLPIAPAPPDLLSPSAYAML